MTDPNHMTDTELRDELLLRRLRHWRGAMGDIQTDAGVPQDERENRLEELLPAQTGDSRKEPHEESQAD